MNMKGVVLGYSIFIFVLSIFNFFLFMILGWGILL